MSTTTTNDGVQIFYKDWGEGQPIVFHHGWPLRRTTGMPRCCSSCIAAFASLHSIVAGTDAPASLGWP